MKFLKTFDNEGEILLTEPGDLEMIIRQGWWNQVKEDYIVIVDISIYNKLKSSIKEIDS